MFLFSCILELHAVELSRAVTANIHREKFHVLTLDNSNDCIVFLREVLVRVERDNVDGHFVLLHLALRLCATSGHVGHF